MNYQFHLTSLTPLLVHADDVLAADRLSAWRKAPENKGAGGAGDDRVPPWSWQTYLYTDGKHLTIPAFLLMAALRNAGGKMKIKGNQSYKALTQTGLLLEEDHFPILVDGKPIPLEAIQKIDGAFENHMKAVEKLGFSLDVQRKKVGQSKHVRVRPLFEHWALKGTIRVQDQAWKQERLTELLRIAGLYSGLGDERPSGKTPGPYGQFKTTIKTIN